MALIAAIKFSQHEVAQPFLPGPLKREDLKINDFYIVLRDGEEEVGFLAAIENWCPIQLEQRDALPMLLRKASEAEVVRWWEVKSLEMRALQLCKAKATEHNLMIKVSTCRYESKANKLTFQFTSDKRVDFRALVRDLAAALRCRIELWQVGVREEAQDIDGMGVCGLRQCCSCWIGEFKPINLKMAKDQDIELPPAKLTGNCGRLLCCLDYEVEAYQELANNAIPKGASVVHSGGRGVVLDRNLINKTYWIGGEEGKTATLPASAIQSWSPPESSRGPGCRRSQSAFSRESRGREEENGRAWIPDDTGGGKKYAAPNVSEEQEDAAPEVYQEAASYQTGPSDAPPSIESESLSGRESSAAGTEEKQRDSRGRASHRRGRGHSSRGNNPPRGDARGNPSSS